jgi:hypothetical protein
LTPESPFFIVENPIKGDPNVATLGAIVIQATTDTQDFVHPELGREVTAIDGHYVFGKEIRLPYNGRELLYFVGYAVLDATCCGMGGCAYVLVPGFIRQWKYKKNQRGFNGKYNHSTARVAATPGWNPDR